jgi:hypothetical protein
VYSNAMCGAAAGRQNEGSSSANPSPFEAAGGGEGSSLGINFDSPFDRAQKASPRYTLCFLLLARCCTHRGALVSASARSGAYPSRAPFSGANVPA